MSFEDWARHAVPLPVLGDHKGRPYKRGFLMEQEPTFHDFYGDRLTIPPTVACQGCTEVLIGRQVIETIGRRLSVIFPPS